MRKMHAGSAAELGSMAMTLTSEALATGLNGFKRTRPLDLGWVFLLRKFSWPHHMSLGETLVRPCRIDFPGYWKLHQSRFRPPINKLSARKYDGPTGVGTGHLSIDIIVPGKDSDIS
jgi:hypothetical protein